MILSADPGREAGAALVDVDAMAVIAWWAWRWMDGRGGRYDLVSSAPGVTHAPSMTLIGGGIGLIVHEVHDAWPVVVVEAQHVRPQRGTKRINPQTTITLAREAGQLEAAMLLSSEGVLGPSPQASEWAAVIGAAGLPADRMTEAAVRYARRALSWPECGPPTRETAGSDDAAGAVHEAVIMALWAQSREE